MAEQRIKYAFRLVHIDNISHVNRYGFVHKDSKYAKPDYVPIGDQSIIKVRDSASFPGVGRIGKCIPFYFGPRSPMLYVIQNGFNNVTRYSPEQLVYCVVLLEDLIRNNIDCIFTDGHALSGLTTIYPKEELPNINNIIRYSDVYTKYWFSEDDLDLKRRKEAEILVKEELGPEYIKGYVVYNANAKDKLLGFGINPEKIVIKQDYYF